MTFQKPWPLVAAIVSISIQTQSYSIANAADSAAVAKTGATFSSQPESATIESESPLTLRQALALALKHNPELSAYSQELRASEAAVLQAGVLPNPVFDVTVDNLTNSRLRNDGDRTTTIQIGQLIELGGKRASRITLSETGRDLAKWDYEAKRIDVLSRISQYFIDVVAAQRGQALAGETLQLAQQVADAVGKRVLAGKVSPIEETKARLALSSAQIEREQAARQLAAARSRLAAMWNNSNPQFRYADADLEKFGPLPDYKLLAERVSNNPDLARWSSEVARRQASIDVERAKAVPDITLSAGLRRFSQFDDHAYTVGISIPIPVFDQNRGGILEANRRLDKSIDEQRAAASRLQTELSQIFHRVSAIRSEIDMLRTSILPGARSAYDGVTKGYQLGKFGVLDVLDAQRTLYQAQSQYLKALADYHRGLNEIERLVGGPLDAPAQNADKR
jgi:cobalt-zinc-cadmium efflux system outer membrane protein